MIASKIELAAGEVLFREGDPPTSAYLIEQGMVEVSTVRQGERVVLNRLGPGDLLGEMAIIDDRPRTATATAVGGSTLLVIDRAQIAERLASADPIIRSLLEGQLRRYRGGLEVMKGSDYRKAQAKPPASAAPGGIDKMRLEAQLRAALDEQALEVQFQPILEIGSGRISGYEALVRWTHPVRGPVSPGEFIALAEETSLIVPVGEYVIAAAGRALSALRGAGVDPMPFVAINVSPRQLAVQGLIERIIEAAAKAGLPPNRVKVEITESQALTGNFAAEVIERCRGHGIAVALDDFGTGYSNLSHLHGLEFDTVKVDQAFARSMLESPRAMALMEGIVAMIHALGADVLVEGIETEAQLEALRRLGCRYAQGYLIGRAQPLEQIVTAPSR